MTCIFIYHKIKEDTYTRTILIVNWLRFILFTLIFIFISRHLFFVLWYFWEISTCEYLYSQRVVNRSRNYGESNEVVLTGSQHFKANVYFRWNHFLSPTGDLTSENRKSTPYTDVYEKFKLVTQTC